MVNDPAYTVIPRTVVEAAASPGYVDAEVPPRGIHADVSEHLVVLAAIRVGGEQKVEVSHHNGDFVVSTLG